MLKKICFAVAPLLLAVGLWSCQSEISGEGIVLPGNTPSGWTTQTVAAGQQPARLLLNGLQPATQGFSISMATGGVCTGSRGIRIIIPDNAFVKLDGSPVTGVVDVSIKEATTFADMIAFGTGTVTDNSLLATGGMVQIAARQGADVLKLKTGKTIDIKIQTPFVPGFKGFAGRESGNTENPVTWTENNNWAVRSDSLQGGAGVNIQIDSIGWVNCDRFYNEPNPTNIYLKLPEAYGNTNTACYIIFKTDRVMSGLKGDAVNKQFWQGSYYKVPAGKLVRLIAISKKDNKIYYGSTEVTITADMTVTMSQLDEVTETELKTRLNAL